MISYSESYLKQLISASCCLLLATKVRAKKRDICSSSSISTEIGMNLSNWFYPRPQIEPTKREKDYWNPIIPTVLFRCIIVKRLLSQRDAANRSTLLCIGLLEHYHSNSPFLRVIVKGLLLQGDAANRSTFLCIGNLGIHLCCCHILVTEITLHNRNTCSCVQLETGKAVA